MIMRMLFRKETRDPKALMSIGSLFLAISIAWPRFIPITGTLGTDAIDLIKGLLLGVALGLMILALFRGSRRPNRAR
jgi:hypothetical protein